MLIANKTPTENKAFNYSKNAKLKILAINKIGSYSVLNQN
jgi:hypothetical protein